jgi:hypothetical protein
MSRSATVLMGAAALAGTSLIDKPRDPAVAEATGKGAYMIEIAAAFDAAAVRAALPEGVEPAPGFTGGLAVQSGDGDWLGPYMAAGYLWIDLAPTQGAPDHPTRYLVGELIFQNVHALGSQARLVNARAGGSGGDGPVIQARFSAGELGLFVDLLWDETECAQGEIGVRPVLAADRYGQTGVVHMPRLSVACPVEVLNGWLTVPKGHPLEGFATTTLLRAAAARSVRDLAPADALEAAP